MFDCKIFLKHRTPVCSQCVWSHLTVNILALRVALVWEPGPGRHASCACALISALLLTPAPDEALASEGGGPGTCSWSQPAWPPTCALAMRLHCLPAACVLCSNEAEFQKHPPSALLGVCVFVSSVPSWGREYSVFWAGADPAWGVSVLRAQPPWSIKPRRGHAPGR